MERRIQKGKKMGKFKLTEVRGVIPALITSFDEFENFDETRMRSVVRYLMKSDIGGLYLTGSTGETFLMTLEERKRVTEVVIDEVKGKIPVIVHIGDIGTKKSIELAEHAYEAGADAISSVPPFYWKFSEEDIIGYYKDISKATPLPMIVYNIALAGLVGFNTIMKLSEIDGVQGVKYTAATQYEITRLKEELGEGFLVYSGMDEMAMSSISYGADGLIGTFYNLMPEIFIEIESAVQKGNIAGAAKKQQVANKIILEALKYDYISLMKQMMKVAGVDAGYSRKPFKTYSEKEIGEIFQGFVKIKEEYGANDIRFLENLKL